MDELLRNLWAAEVRVETAKARYTDAEATLDDSFHRFIDRYDALDNIYPLRGRRVDPQNQRLRAARTSYEAANRAYNYQKRVFAEASAELWAADDAVDKIAKVIYELHCKERKQREKGDRKHRSEERQQRAPQQRTGQQSSLSQEQNGAFLQALRTVFADIPGMNAFPEAPAEPCSNISCQATRANRSLQACSCNIKAIFAAISTAELKTYRNKLHPVRYAAVESRMRGTQKKAQELFVVNNLTEAVQAQAEAQKAIKEAKTDYRKQREERKSAEERRKAEERQKAKDERREAPDEPPSARKEQKQMLSQDRINAFIETMKVVLANILTMAAFPEPPYAPYGDVSCLAGAKDRCLKACACNLREIYGGLSLQELKLLRHKVHPDRYAVVEARLPSTQKKAQEIFVVVQALHDEL